MGGLSRDAFVYGLASLVGQGALLLAVPVYTRMLGPAGFGTVELLVVGLNLVALAVMGGLDLAAIRLYFAHEDEAMRRRMLSTGLLFVVVMSCLGAIVVLLLDGVIERSYLNNFDGDESVVVAAIALPLFVAARYVRESFRAQRRPWTYLANSGTAAILQVGLGVVLVAGFNFGPSGVMVGYLVAAFVTLLWGVASSRRVFGVQFAMPDLRSLLSFGVPLVWTGLAGWSLMFVDRLVLSAFVDLDDVGIYALASRVAMGLTLVTYAFNRAWMPIIFEAAESDREESRRIRVDVLETFITGIAWLAVAVSVLADPVVRLVAGAEFSDAGDLVPIIAYGLVFFALGPVVQVTMLIDQKTRLLAWVSVGSAVTNLAANFALIPAFGVAGAAWSTLIAFAVQAAAYWKLAQGMERVDYRTGAIVRLIVVCGVFIAFSWLAFPAGFVGLVARLSVVAVFPVFLLLSRGASVESFRRLARLVSR